MPSIETYRKQAKLLVRWHRERNYSIGEKLRLLGRYRHLTDVEVLDMAMPLTLAQEIVAVEAGFRDWAALKTAAGDVTLSPRVDASGPDLGAVSTSTCAILTGTSSPSSNTGEAPVAWRTQYLHLDTVFRRRDDTRRSVSNALRRTAFDAAITRVLR